MNITAHVEKNNFKDVLRYLRLPKEAFEREDLKETCERIKEISEYALSIVAPKAVSVRMSKAEFLAIEPYAAVSKNLEYLLRNSDEIVLVALTLGLETERALSRFTKENMADAVIFDVIISDLAEQTCENYQQDLNEFLKNENKKTTPRFSAGYGDWSLEAQKNILELLNAKKRIGLYLSEGMMLFPTKSVTMLMGIVKTDIL